MTRTGKVYQRMELGRTLFRAHRTSARDGQVRYIFGTYSGYKISTRRPPQKCLWTNGREAGTWLADKSSGQVDSALMQRLASAEKVVTT